MFEKRPLDEFKNYPYQTSANEQKLIDTAYWNGILGAMAILILGYLFANRGWFLKQIPTLNYFGFELHASLVALAIITGLMVTFEIIRRFYFEGKDFFCLDPNIVAKNYSIFLKDAVARYVGGLFICGVLLIFYKYCREYGYQNNGAYYKPFFQVMNLAAWGYLFFGLPYIILTRALQYNPKADEFGLANATFVRVFSLLRKLPFTNDKIPEFKPVHKIALLGLVVKVFFLPLMIVFFLDQFQHLTSNWNFVRELYAKGSLASVIEAKNLFNIGFSVIFSIDVGIAVIGYGISTRWLKNSNYSVEPTIAGWLVAAFCYPPLNRSVLGIYMPTPSDRLFLSWETPWLIYGVAIMTILSFCVYTAATIVFGIRFSNLTHRGIITKGPFAYVRHPAYASKNFSWWCVGFPVVIYNFVQGNLTYAIPHFFGLIGITSWYYFRALTEERHLNWDPQYQDYCKKVRYRFCPGLF